MITCAVAVQTILFLLFYIQYHFLLFIGLANGSVTAEFPDPAVSTSLLLQILQWKEEGATEEDIHCRLRCHTVPDGYSYTTWKPGVLRVA